MRWAPLLLLVLFGCTAEHGAEGSKSSTSASTPAAVAAPNPWCSALPALTADPSGDLTGKANTEGRVHEVRAKHDVDQVLWKCRGVVGVGMTLAPIQEHLLAGDFDTWAPSHLKPAKGDERDYVLTVMLVDAAAMPRKNPLYLDGVRVYFEATGPITPL